MTGGPSSRRARGRAGSRWKEQASAERKQQPAMRGASNRHAGGPSQPAVHAGASAGRTSRRSPMRRARLRLPLKTEDPRPKGQSLAMATASSSLENLTTAGRWRARCRKGSSSGGREWAGQRLAAAGASRHRSIEARQREGWPQADSMGAPPRHTPQQSPCHCTRLQPHKIKQVPTRHHRSKHLLLPDAHGRRDARHHSGRVELAAATRQLAARHNLHTQDGERRVQCW